MQRVKCYECGKVYDYHEDGFCPRCGSFNQPPRAARISADGTVVRVDGLNEAAHEGSFVHQELHAEKRQRRKYGLDKSMRSIQKVVGEKGRMAGFSPKDRKNPLSVLGWIILAIIVLNFFSSFLYIFF